MRFRKKGFENYLNLERENKAKISKYYQIVSECSRLTAKMKILPYVDK